MTEFALQPPRLAAGEPERGTLQQGWARCRRVATSLEELARGWGRVELAATFTLLLTLLYTGRSWALQVPVALLCSSAVLAPAARRSSELWLALFVVLALGNAADWYQIDNHQYLITYWCLALCCACASSDPERALASHGRMLIGLTFLFATIWKASSADFLDGTFFHYALLIDQRFASVAELVAGVAAPALEQNQAVLHQLLAAGSSLDGVQLVDSPHTALVADCLTAWTIGIELAIAVAFLTPTTGRLSRWRDWLLIAFSLTTYAVAPVIGFGWVLTAMGVAQSDPRARHARLGYIAAFFALQVLRAPWAAVFGLVAAR